MDAAHARMFALSGDGVLIVTAHDHRIAYANAAASRMLGRNGDLAGTDFGVPVDGSEVDLVGSGGDVAEMRVSGIEFEGASAWLVMLRDVTERVRALKSEKDERRALDVALTERAAALRRQSLLIGELNHRVKNTLAIVQSVARRTFDRPDMPDDLTEAFESRLGAIARSHELLMQESWGAVPLGDVVRRTLDPFRTGEGRVGMDGPVVPLRPKTAVTFAMALHELATNAVKYGALSVPDGTVAIAWSSADLPSGNQTLRFVWKENGGPRVMPPVRRGFGTTLIERALPVEVGGTATLSYRPEGLIYELTAPMPETRSVMEEALS